MSTGRHPGTKPTRVAVLDAEPIFRDSVAACIGKVEAMRVEHSASHPESVLRMCEQGEVDVLVLDIALDPHGHLMRFAATARGNPAILVLAHELLTDDPALRAALSSGAHGLLCRCAPRTQLQQAISAVRRDRQYLDPRLSARLAGLAPLPRSSGFSGLSRREFEIFNHLTSGSTTATMARKLSISTETVRSHLKNIFRKLEVRDRPQAVAEGIRRGLLTI